MKARCWLLSQQHQRCCRRRIKNHDLHLAVRSTHLARLAKCLASDITFSYVTLGGLQIHVR